MSTGLIVIVVLITLIIAFTGYYVYKNMPQTQAIVTPELPSVVQVPSTEQGSTEQVTQPTISIQPNSTTSN